MSLTTARRFYRSLDEADVEAALRLVHPDVTWVVPEGLPEGGTYRGVDEVRSLFSARSAWGSFLIEHRNWIDAGDVVVLEGAFVKGGHRVGFCNVLTFQRGLLVRFANYVDTRKALPLLQEPDDGGTNG